MKHSIFPSGENSGELAPNPGADMRIGSPPSVDTIQSDELLLSSFRSFSDTVYAIQPSQGDSAIPPTLFSAWASAMSNACGGTASSEG